MQTHSEKTQVAQGHSVAGGLTQTPQNGSPFLVPEDNRQETITQRKLQELANNSTQVRQAAAFTAMANGGAATLSINRAGPPVQMKVQVGNHVYESKKKGFGMQILIDRIIAAIASQAAASQGTATPATTGQTTGSQHATNQAPTLTIPRNWKAHIKDLVRDENIVKRFNSLQDVIVYLISRSSSAAEKRRRQHARIQGMNRGFGAGENKRGRVLAYESRKAHARVTGQVEGMRAYRDTKADLEALPPGLRSSHSDFRHTHNQFMNLHALDKASLQRLDFKAPGNVDLNTLGYSSLGNRGADASTVQPSFSLGTVKVAGIPSYIQEGATSARPPQQPLAYLNMLEINRLPQLSAQTAMKRGLYNQGHFSKEEGMGYDHDHSSVEFIGAVTGSSLTTEQRDLMQQQQIRSNYAILQTAYDRFPDTPIAPPLHNQKHVPTPREEKNLLDSFIDVTEDAQSSPADKHNAKKALRKVLTQNIRGFAELEDVDSEDEAAYPTSPYTSGDYD